MCDHHAARKPRILNWDPMSASGDARRLDRELVGIVDPDLALMVTVESSAASITG